VPPPTSRRPLARRVVALLAAAACLSLSAGCRQREPPEWARAKTKKAYLDQQVAALTDLLAKAERGEVVTADQIAIGIDEDVAREILNAPLPQEQTLGGRLRIRIESAHPFFQGNRPALAFRTRVSAPELPNQFADLELGGHLGELKLVDGRLRAVVVLVHFVVVKASVGPLAQGLLEDFVRGNLESIQAAIPAFEVPVRLEQLIAIPTFEEGPVAARGGELPLSAEVSQVLVLNRRLWVLIASKAGPWKSVKDGKS
jgi:hypothetical protein